MTGSPLVTYSFFGPDFAHGGGQPSINVGVVHDVECPLQPHYARTLCGPDYFGHGGDQGHAVSIHYVVGPDDICQGTDEETIAYHVGSSNPGTIGIEQCGYASLDRASWLAGPYGNAQLANLARLIADISRRRPLIQLRWLTDDEALYALDHKAAPGGWVTHRQLSRIGRSTGHTDPGAYYPLDVLMDTAQGGVVVDWLDGVSVADLETVLSGVL